MRAVKVVGDGGEMWEDGEAGMQRVEPLLPLTVEENELMLLQAQRRRLEKTGLAAAELEEIMQQQSAGQIHKF